MKTSSEFQKHYNKKFNNNDIAWDLECILDGVLSRDGIIACEYGMLDNDEFRKVNNDDEIADQYFIDIEDSSYFYEWDDQRNVDIKIIEQIIKEFRIANNLSNNNPVFQL